MASKEKSQPPSPEPAKPEPVAGAQPTSREAITGSGALEKRASVFPVPAAGVTPVEQIMSGTGPATGPVASVAPTDGGTGAPAQPAPSVSENNPTPSSGE